MEVALKLEVGKTYMSRDNFAVIKILKIWAERWHVSPAFYAEYEYVLLNNGKTGIEKNSIHYIQEEEMAFYEIEADEYSKCKKEGK